MLGSHCHFCYERAIRLITSDSEVCTEDFAASDDEISVATDCVVSAVDIYPVTFYDHGQLLLSGREAVRSRH